MALEKIIPKTSPRLLNQPIKAALNRVQGIRLQYKILGLVIGVIFLLSSMIIWQMDNILTMNLRQQLDKHVVSIGRDVAARAAHDLLMDNSSAIHQLVQNTLRNNENVLYIFVVDPQGKVLAHTFAKGFPNELLKVNSVSVSEKSHLKVYRNKSGLIRDVAVPILEGKLGVVRVGMDEFGLREAVAKMTWNLLLITLFVSILGFGAAAFLTRILTQPIRQLVSLTQQVAKGDFGVEGVVNSRDEIGVLTQAFNQMTRTLSQNHREREELMAELRVKEEMRVHLLEKVISAQEEERKRIARELHDETSQALTSIMVGLKLLESDSVYWSAGNRLQQMRDIVARTLDEVHYLARELRPSVLDDMGLAVALERYVRDYAKNYAIEVDFHVSGFEGQRAPAPVEVALYRIVQEALTNVAKYAKANSVSVLLDLRDGYVSAIVEDDGCGFDLERLAGRPEQGLGFFGMQERAALLGGTFKIESKPGSGTTVFIKIPLGPKKLTEKEGIT